MDTNVILESYRTGSWRALAGDYGVETAEECVHETQTGSQRREPERRIDEGELRGSLRVVHSVGAKEARNWRSGPRTSRAAGVVGAVSRCRRPPDEDSLGTGGSNSWLRRLAVTRTSESFRVLATRRYERRFSALCAVAEPVWTAFLWRPQLRDPADEMVLEAAINSTAVAEKVAAMKTAEFFARGPRRPTSRRRGGFCVEREDSRRNPRTAMVRSSTSPWPRACATPKAACAAANPCSPPRSWSGTCCGRTCRQSSSFGGGGGSAFGSLLSLSCQSFHSRSRSRIPSRRPSRRPFSRSRFKNVMVTPSSPTRPQPGPCRPMPYVSWHGT